MNWSNSLCSCQWQLTFMTNSLRENPWNCLQDVTIIGVNVDVFVKTENIDRPKTLRWLRIQSTSFQDKNYLLLSDALIR